MMSKKSDPKKPAGDGLFANPVEMLANGLCQGLRNPPRNGESIFTLAMDVDDTERDGFLTVHSATHVSLSDSSVRAGTDYGMFDCQTCTLFVEFGGETALATKSF